MTNDEWLAARSKTVAALYEHRRKCTFWPDFGGHRPPLQPDFGGHRPPLQPHPEFLNRLLRAARGMSGAGRASPRAVILILIPHSSFPSPKPPLPFVIRHSSFVRSLLTFPLSRTPPGIVEIPSHARGCVLHRILLTGRSVFGPMHGFQDGRLAREGNSTGRKKKLKSNKQTNKTNK